MKITDFVTLEQLYQRAVDVATSRVDIDHIADYLRMNSSLIQ